MVTEIFPIYDLLVNNIFGSVGLALVGVAVAMWVILVICRMSTIFVVYWVVLFYGSVAFTLYLVRGVGLIIVFLFSVMYVSYNIYKIFYPEV